MKDLMANRDNAPYRRSSLVQHPHSAGDGVRRRCALLVDYAAILEPWALWAPFVTDRTHRTEAIVR